MPGVVFASPDACEAERLAGVAAADDVGSLNAAPVDGGDVAGVWDVGPVLGEHTAGVRVDLGLPDDGHASPLEAEVDPADAGKQ
jgi:hypothetical protein